MTARWQEQALCAQTDPDLWFPDVGHSTAAAQEICRRCPVQFQCAQAGEWEQHGVWGGLTTGQRRNLFRGGGVLDEVA